MNALRARMQLLVGRLSEGLGTTPEAMSSWSQAAVGVATAAVFVAGVGLIAAGPPQDVEPTSPPGDDVARTVDQLRSGSGGRTPGGGGGGGGVRRSPPNAPPLSAIRHEVEQSANEALTPVIGPSEVDNQEGGTTSFVLSPQYDKDRTVFASSDHMPHSWLRVSDDGGARWRRLEARGLGARARLLLPPSYPDDGRMFAMTILGLQVSRDGGRTFDTVAPVPLLWSDVSAMLSPAFDHGHPTVLFTADGQLYEYHDGTGLVRPLVLQNVWGTDVRIDTAQYATAYPTILVVTRSLTAPFKTPRMYRCRASDPTLATSSSSGGVLGLQCGDETELSESSTSPIGLPSVPVDGLTTGFARAGYDVYASDDGGRTFRLTPRLKSGIYQGRVADIAIARSTTGSTAVVAQSRYGFSAIPPLERTVDGGLTWTPLFVDLPAFADGATTVAVTPTGRILAGGWGGMGCSDDDGRTWAPTCATPDLPS